MKVDKKWKILLLDTKKSNPNHYICLAIKEAFESHSRTDVVVKAGYGDAIALARENKCNLFVAFDGEELERGICARLASLCGASILWITEDPYELQINKENSDIFDIVFTNNSESVSAYGLKGRHLPFAASAKIHHHEICDDGLLYDVFFAGTAWPNRVSFLKKLEPELRGLKLKIALPHNPHLLKPDLRMAPSSYLWKTPNSEFARFANKSRVTLTLHRNFSSSGNDSTAATPGPRLFEVALAGGFQLIDMSLPEVTNYFDEDTQFAGFRSEEECIEKIKYYLTNPDKRIKMAQSAQNRASKEHLYLNRVDTIFLEISKLKKRQSSSVRKKLPKVLIVTHNIQGVQPYGGVEVYQQALITALKKHFQFYIYTVDRTVLPLGRRNALYDDNMTIVETHDFDTDIPDTLLTCPARERVFSEILSRLDVHLVHFQHLISHTPSLPYITKALGIPSIFSLHDYYAVCRHFNLIGYQDNYCNVSSLPTVSCDICLNAKDNIAIGSQASRRAFFARILEQVDVLHANTEGVASMYKEIFPHLRLSNKLQICGVPLPVESNTPQFIDGTRPVDIIHVAIIGNFTKNKGADVIIYALNQLRNDNVKFHIFGTVIEPYNTILQQLALPNVEIHGVYTAGSITNQLKTMTLSLHLSIWPETYCITLSEVWQAGVVPIVSDIGALGERVTHGVNGFIVPKGEPGPVVAIIKQLITQPEKIDKAREGINAELFVTVETHSIWLKKLYDKLLCDLNPIKTSDFTNASVSISLSDCGIVLNKNVWVNENGSGRTQHQAQVISIINSNVVKHRSLLNKVIAYRKTNGTKGAFLRIVREIKRISRISIGKKQL